MSDLKTQKRIAGEVLGIGRDRVWINPGSAVEVAQAMTREDVREIIKQGLIQEKPKKKQTRARAKKRQELKRKRKGVSHGKRKGSAGGRKSSREKWMERVRSQRRFLLALKESKALDKKAYRKYYLRVKGGQYPAIRQLKEAMKTEGVLKEASKKSK